MPATPPIASQVVAILGARAGDLWMASNAEANLASASAGFTPGTGWAVR